MIMDFLSFSHRDSINCGEIWSCLRPLSTSTQNPEALHRLWRNKKPFWSSPSSKGWVGGLVTMQVIGITCVCGRYCSSNCDTQSVKRISHLPSRFYRQSTDLASDSISFLFQFQTKDFLPKFKSIPCFRTCLHCPGKSPRRLFSVLSSANPACSLFLPRFVKILL